MSRLPIDQMVKDACLLERENASVGGSSLADDVVCHVKALAAEVERLEQKHNQAIETVAACLVAAGVSEDIDELEQQVEAAGNHPSDFVRQQIERLQSCITEAVNLYTQDVCMWHWVHRMRKESGLEPLKEAEERQPIVNEQTAKIQMLKAEVERLESVLQLIVARSRGGTGAAVVVTITTLGKIAEQALAFDTPGDTG